MEQNQSFRGNHRGGFRGGGFRGNNRGGGFRGNNRGGFRGGRGRGGFRQNHEDVDYSPEAIERRFARFYLPSMSQDPWAHLEQKYKK